MTLRRRIEALEQQIKLPEEERRMILVWRDSEGRLTKAADSHPELPDDYPYHRDLSRRNHQPVEAPVPAVDPNLSVSPAGTVPSNAATEEVRP